MKGNKIIIQQINILLENLTSPEQFSKLHALIKGLVPEVTCWGGRILRVEGTNESIPIRTVAGKFFRTFDNITRNLYSEAHGAWLRGDVASVQALSKQRNAFIEVAKDVNTNLYYKYEVIDRQIAQSNIFVRVLAVLRKYLCMFSNGYSEYFGYIVVAVANDTDENEFDKYDLLEHFRRCVPREVPCS